jgi:hypothetical protein
MKKIIKFYNKAEEKLKNDLDIRKMIRATR